VLEATGSNNQFHHMAWAMQMNFSDRTKGLVEVAREINQEMKYWFKT
jgi:hypothetical protein